MKKFEIGSKESGKPFVLPLDVVTQTIAILAKRGKGKTYTASVIAEEMLDAQQQIIVIDPTGAWYGLRSSADGRKAGYPIVVFGGDHADVPLEEGAGELLAGAVVQNRFSAVIDVSNFRKGQTRRFLIAFLETLYRLNREPVHLFVDEADDVCPQRPMGDEAQLVGALEDVVKRGRKKGIGCSLITQRPAALNKDVLTQCEVLVTLGLSHPLDIKAIMEWVNVHADVAEAKRMTESLPSLPIGTAWFWSPGWGDFFDKIQVRRRHTFDSSATPKPGVRVSKPKVLAKIDIQNLGKQIAETAERARAADPSVLKLRIKEYEKKMGELTTRLQMEATAKAVRTIEVPYVPQSILKSVDELCCVVAKEVKKIKTNTARVEIRVVTPPVKRDSVYVSRLDPAKNPYDAEKIPTPERKILTALAQYPEGRTKSQTAILTGYAQNGGAFRNPLGALRSKQWIVGADHLKITDAGRKALGSYQPLPTGRALAEHWLQRLPRPERAILGVLIQAWPNGLSKEDTAERAGYDPTGGAFRNPLGKLRTLELVTGQRDEPLKASNNLMED